MTVFSPPGCLFEDELCAPYEFCVDGRSWFFTSNSAQTSDRVPFYFYCQSFRSSDMCISVDSYHDDASPRWWRACHVADSHVVFDFYRGC